MKEQLNVLKASSSKMSQEKSELHHRHRELGEVVASFRNELVGKDRRIRDMETEISMVSLR